MPTGSLNPKENDRIGVRLHEALEDTLDVESSKGHVETRSDSFGVLDVTGCWTLTRSPCKSQVISPSVRDPDAGDCQENDLHPSPGF